MMKDSFYWHNRALNHFLTTVGDSHIFTAHPCLAVAGHLVRLGEDRDASSLLDQAIRIYKVHPAYKEDLARAYFLYGQLLSRKPAGASRAREMLNKAADCLNAIYSHAQHKGEDLKEEHFYGLGSLLCS